MVFHFRNRNKRWRRAGISKPLIAVAGAAAVSAVIGAVWVTRGTPLQDRPNIILVIIDTTRADALSAYGNPHGTTPTLDAIAREGVLFEQAISSSSWTLPSIASILTGVHPAIHGAFGKGLKLKRCRDEVVRGAERLQEAGFTTKAIVNAPFLAPELGLDIGFDDYDFHMSTNLSVRRADESVNLAMAHLKAHRTDKNFLLLHLFDPHLCYDPPGMWATKYTDGRNQPPPPLRKKQIEAMVPQGQKAPSQTDRQYVRAVYDAEVAFVDSQIRRLVDALHELGMWDRTTLIITADHGEEFWEHDGFEHGHTMYDELIHVPLILKLPAKYPLARNVVKTQVRTMDLMPTIFELCQLAPLEEFDGQSLVGLMLGAGETAHRTALSEGTLYGADKVSWRIGEYKFILDLKEGKNELYRISDDPAETKNLIDVETRLAKQLLADVKTYRSKLAQRAAEMNPPEPVSMRKRFEDAIRSTGYVR